MVYTNVGSPDLPLSCYTYMDRKKIVNMSKDQFSLCSTVGPGFDPSACTHVPFKCSFLKTIIRYILAIVCVCVVLLDVRFYLHLYAIAIAKMIVPYGKILQGPV